jgi:hypothetical protein
MCGLGKIASIALALLLFAIRPARSESVVYESTLPAGGGYGFSTGLGHEVGESIGLAGTDRLITRIDLLLAGSPNLEFRVRFYGLDAATGLPSNLIWESPSQFYPPFPPFDQTVSIPVPTIAVPDSMAWTFVQITPDPFNMIVRTALSPSVGTFNNYLARDPFPFRTNLFSDGTFGARLIAVPEPASLCLAIAGITGLALIARRHSKNSHYQTDTLSPFFGFKNWASRLV